MSETMSDRDDGKPATGVDVGASSSVGEKVAPRIRRRRSATKAPPLATCPPPGPAVAEGPKRRLPDLGGIRRKAFDLIRQAWRWLQARSRWQLASKRLCLCETVALGEKRFLAIVKVDGRHFLVGGAASSVSMLAQLDGQPEFAGILKQRAQGGRKKA